MQPVRWAIAPSTIVVPHEGPAFLAGSRSRYLIEEITKLSKILGGTVRTLAQPRGPSVVQVIDLDFDSLQIVAEEVGELPGSSLSLARQPAFQVSTLLPSLSETRRSLPELTTESIRPKRLDLGTGRWRPAKGMEMPGAYRQQRRPWIYSVTPTKSAGDVRRVIADFRLVTYLAAKDAALALIGYDRSRQALLASPGAPLPGLLERVAVLCSGWLPTRSSHEILVYRRVPPSIAEAIWATITAKS